jgi:hypothetical protein
MTQISHFALNRDDSSIRVEMANDTKTLKHFYSCKATESHHLLFKNIHGSRCSNMISMAFVKKQSQRLTTITYCLI